MRPNEFKKILEDFQANPLYKTDQRLYFFGPGFIRYQTKEYSTQKMNFPAISVTGRACSLNCAHCGGKKLVSMLPAYTSDELYDLSKHLVANGCKGFLLSGGCLSDGTVDFQRVLPGIKKIKQEYDLEVYVHTGLVSRQMARRLRQAGINAALIDIIGSSETIKQVYGIDATPLDYYRSLKNLKEESIPVVPHIVIGLHHGKLKGEFKALEIISRCEVSALVLVVLTPLSGTIFEHVSPPDGISVAKVIMTARSLSISPIALGCARPFGKKRIEIERIAVDLGINGIAFPTQETIDYCKTIGRSVSFHKVCCAQIFRLAKKEENFDRK